ncbi:AAA family ATPase [bacterium]|nr:AAA family ATPase [bacterium]
MADSAEQSKTQLSLKDKIISLFHFIQELNKIKQKTVLNVKDYPWFLPVLSLHDDPENITINFRDRVEDEVIGTSSTLLSVRKAEFQLCPTPDPILKDWLEDGWDDFRQINAKVKKERYVVNRDDESVSIPKDINGLDIKDKEQFDDDEKRVSTFDAWKTKREIWLKKQQIIAKTRDLFSKLFSIYFELKKESETEEIIVANGMLYDKLNNEIKHPVLTHRVSMEFDSDKNIIYIEDTDTPSELYTVLFQKMDGVKLSSINQLNENLLKNDYHPLDRNDTPQFLKILMNELSSESKFCEEYSPEILKGNWRLLIVLEPCFIVRKRLDGAVKTIETIVETVQNDGEIPSSLRDIVSGGIFEITEEDHEDTIEERLASVGGESIDIFLSKEANREQLEIAKRIDRYNAVLVQGPPGTGKTHTIANLMGHFFAQGKSVLVTSYTKKALRVLKEKIADGLQNLCVSILDDSNIDMERSIDGITEYLSRTTSFALQRDIEDLSAERNNIIKKLSGVRQNIFKLIQQESNNIELNGEGISPSKAAKFVVENAETLSYIPGDVSLYKPLPLTIEKLKDLYKSNEFLTPQEELELKNELPDPSSLINPSDLKTALEEIRKNTECINSIEQKKHLSINFDNKNNVSIKSSFGELVFALPSIEKADKLKEFFNSFDRIETWMRNIIIDGDKGGSYRQNWIKLIEKIEETCDLAKIVAGEKFGKKIVLPTENIESLHNVYKQIREKFNSDGKLSKLTLFFLGKDYKHALSLTRINDHEIENVEECDTVIHCLKLRLLRKECSIYWDELMAFDDIPAFFKLDVKEPESKAFKFLPKIKKYLDWYKEDFSHLNDSLIDAGIPTNLFNQQNELDSDLDNINRILDVVDEVIRPLCEVVTPIYNVLNFKDAINDTVNILKDKKLENSEICQKALSAIRENEVLNYENAFIALDSLYNKYAIQKERNKLLAELEPYAHQWAMEISNRQGIHGKATLPENIELAWKWKQLSGIINDLTKQSLTELQNESVELSKSYRNTTAKFAEKCGWYHLLKRIEADISMKQALVGWKQTQKKIGKGTGKSAPKFKEEARKLMVKCQKAVPGWIMPINRALEVLKADKNQFDVVIVDEASQADISSLAILYMGKKLIIVGDDKQVSPMAIGVPDDKVSALEQMYIKDKIPNSHLYNGKTSIYDIASTTFQPLMLREHFRCVPEIIGFSNMLSYDCKIKPLRDASSSVLFPAVINYRVKNGFREGKTNVNEAKTIIALMQACISQKEYEGKTMGVISLLGDEQAKLIQRLIEINISHKEIVNRNIISGNSANFQGDERDVIFLSIVDSHDDNGPLPLRDYGPDDTYRKRYNVATSRAKDQLWVIHSLDPENDLKSGDIRKILINYSIDPNAIDNKIKSIEDKAESPFEKEIATALSSRGFNLIQQYEVGAYRLDIVVVCGTKKIAIECDGERYHSGESKIREDLERETILARSGWRFIRIRGSEYYRDKENTIKRVIAQLKEKGIEPEESISSQNDGRETELLKRLKVYADNYLTKIIDNSNEPIVETIASALNPSSVVKKASGSDTKLNKIANKNAESDNSGNLTDEKFNLTINPSGTIQRFANVDIYRNKSNYDKFKSKYNVESSDDKNDSVEKITQKGIDRKNTDKSNDLIENNATNTSKNTTGQQFLFPGKEKPKKDINGLINYLNANRIKFIDKRHLNGALWIVGGKELYPIIERCKDFGFYFWFKQDGGKQTGYKPGWWTK